jgi:hypothetical protein
VLSVRTENYFRLAAASNSTQKQKTFVVEEYRDHSTGEMVDGTVLGSPAGSRIFFSEINHGSGQVLTGDHDRRPGGLLKDRRSQRQCLQGRG